VYPRDARQSLCSGKLLMAATRAVIERRGMGAAPASWVVTDPDIVTNRDIEGLVRERAPRPLRVLPLPLGAVGAALRRLPAIHHPSLDLQGRGKIYGYLTMDIAYDGTKTNDALGLDPAAFSRAATLVPALDAEFARAGVSSGRAGA
jgi:hypothetical protein